MKKNGQITAFYIEALLLIVVFLAIILVLTQVFGLARQQSIAAGQLTDAVTLAGNAAEAVSASADPDELFHLLDGHLSFRMAGLRRILRNIKEFFIAHRHSPSPP